jgi:hypothetical protein
MEAEESFMAKIAVKQAPSSGSQGGRHIDVVLNHPVTESKRFLQPSNAPSSQLAALD